MINLKEKPKGWRDGQTIFNFLEWIAKKDYAPTVQSKRMADPFHIDDIELETLYKQFLKDFK